MRIYNNLIYNNIQAFQGKKKPTSPKQEPARPPVTQTPINLDEFIRTNTPSDEPPVNNGHFDFPFHSRFISNDLYSHSNITPKQQNSPCDKAEIIKYLHELKASIGENLIILDIMEQIITDPQNYSQRKKEAACNWNYIDKLVCDHKDIDAENDFYTFRLANIMFTKNLSMECIEKIIEKKININLLKEFRDEEQVRTYINLDNILSDSEKKYIEEITSGENAESGYKLVSTGIRHIISKNKKNFSGDDIKKILFSKDYSVKDKIEILDKGISLKELCDIKPYIKPENLYIYTSLEEKERNFFKRIINKDLTSDCFDSVEEQAEYLNRLVELSQKYNNLNQHKKALFGDITDTSQQELKHIDIPQLIADEIIRIDSLITRTEIIDKLNSNSIIKDINELLDSDTKQILTQMDKIKLSNMLTLINKCLSKKCPTSNSKEKKQYYKQKEIKTLIKNTNLTIEQKLKVVDNDIDINHIITLLNQMAKGDIDIYLNLQESERKAFDKFNHKDLTETDFETKNAYNNHKALFLTFIKEYVSMTDAHKKIFNESIQNFENTYNSKETHTTNEKNEKIDYYNNHIGFAKQFKNYAEYNNYIYAINLLENVNIQCPPNRESALNTYYDQKIFVKRTLFPSTKIPEQITRTKLPQKIFFPKKYITLSQTQREAFIDIIKNFIKYHDWITKQYNEYGLKVLGRIKVNLSGLEEQLNAEIKDRHNIGRILLHIKDLQNPQSEISVIGYAPNGLHANNLENKNEAHEVIKFFD